MLNLGGPVPAVDRHDPLAWMREVVVLGDKHCIFPFCVADSRVYNLDHVVGYDPRGQTYLVTPTGPTELAPPERALSDPP